MVPLLLVFLGLSHGGSQPASSLGLQDPRWPHSYAWALLLTVNWRSLSLSCSRSFIIHRLGELLIAETFQGVGNEICTFSEPSETYTISFYRSKRVLMPAQIQGLGKRLYLLIGRILTNVWSYFIFIKQVKTDIKTICQKARSSSFLRGSDYFLYLFSHFKLRVQPHSRSHCLSVEQYWCLWMEKI